MEIGNLGVTAARGFQAAGGSAGIKKNNTKDMALIYSTVPCVAAGTFTRNLVKAAPVKWDQHIVYDCPTAQAVVVNSGVANAATGRQGYENCEETAKEAAAVLQIPADSVLVASTGVIGQQIPTDKIKAGIHMLAPMLSDSKEAADIAAAAIMTTDTRSKQASVSIELGGKTVNIGGMCKGAGMIHPNMCTMLSFVTTDAAISKEMLQKALSGVVDDSYNMISVDGDTSTNDTCLVMANGLAGNPEITEENEDYRLFAEALFEVNRALAKMIAADGEGASRLFEVKVIHAASKEQAVTLSKAVVTSTLTKAAIFGRDANWGRILCAMGYSGAEFDPEKVDLFFKSAAGELQIVENGIAADYSEEEATRILSENAVTALVDIKMGEAEATAWGCDLTYDYVTINADYRS
ncbi:MAG: bifunctional glutamate N-acetyltransferase/amino-acid acetyltransferase ArgJ [Eubacteriales bacterium]|nr:bifunctional glutamate N-acetyltransferase/amino-acid acetyltransferase ArgJ [Eubacteriales bacterium]